MPIGLRKILLSMIHGFARTLVVSFTSTAWRSAPGAAAVHLVACSDVIGSSGTHICYSDILVFVWKRPLTSVGSASPAFGWRGARVTCLRQVKKEEPLAWQSGGSS